MVIDKGTALEFYLCFREAERSAVGALSTPNHWGEFQIYFLNMINPKFTKILEVIDNQEIGHDFPRQVESFRANIHHIMKKNFLIRLINIYKRNVYISHKIVNLIYLSINNYIKCAMENNPERIEIIEIRRSMYVLCYFIDMELHGIIDTNKYENVNHYNMSRFRIKDGALDEGDKGTSRSSPA